MPSYAPQRGIGLLRIGLSGRAPAIAVTHEFTSSGGDGGTRRRWERVHGGWHQGTPHASEVPHRTAVRLASALGYAPQGSMGLLRIGLSDDAPAAAVTHASNLVEW